MSGAGIVFVTATSRRLCFVSMLSDGVAETARSG
jgi:hypothetical protein